MFICLIALVISPLESGNSSMISVVSSDELPLAEKHVWWLDHLSLFLNLEFHFFRSSVSTNYKTNPLCHSLSTQKTIIISHTIFSQAQHGKEIRFSSAAILDKSWSATKSMLSSTCNQFSGQELQLNLGMSFIGNRKTLFSMHNIRL